MAIPKTVTPNEGQYILIVVPHYWARGETWEEAKKSLRANGGDLDGRFNIYSVDKSTTVNEMGDIMRNKGTPIPELLASN